MPCGQTANRRKAVLRFAGAADLGEEAWAGQEARAELPEGLAEG